MFASASFFGNWTPVINIAPVISGTASVGQVLSCSTGHWVGGGDFTYAFQWKADGSNIGGATASTYLLTSSEAGKVITCTVTATSTSPAHIAASATSNATSAVGSDSPPNSPPDSPPDGDIYFSNVVLLLGFEGTNGATTTSDESASARGAATFSGSSSISTGQFKFGASSLSVTGGGKITFPNSADFNLSPSANSDQFTIEAWIRPHSASNQGFLSFGLFGPNRLCWEFWFTAARQIQLYFSVNGSTLQQCSLQASPQITLDTWAHVACDKDATGKIRLYINGTMMGSVTPANSVLYNNTADTLVVGTGVVGNFDGYIDEVRITKGVARYASDSGFSVPAAAFPRN